ncbi:hypothetical protein ACFVTY_24745 [Streptomyces sp. NPDC058067]|uniref:hypothetical protein n=1 Tax=Streptomyces sp. NPDC058067 TaxID=3346324 RepID=UPI0036E5A7D4
MPVADLDALVEAWFLEKFGHGAITETVYDSGNGVADRIAEVEASRQRLCRSPRCRPLRRTRRRSLVHQTLIRCRGVTTGY